MFKEISERIQKTNDQRVKMALTIINVMETSKDIALKTAVATSMLEMLSTSMIPEDGALVNLINNSIDKVCDTISNETGVSDIKDRLFTILNESKEKIDRIEAGNSILNNINYN
jgi:hypothetical protein